MHPGFRSDDAFSGHSLPKPGTQWGPALFASAIFVSRLEGQSSEERVAPAGSVRRTISCTCCTHATPVRSWATGGLG